MNGLLRRKMPFTEYGPVWRVSKFRRLAFSEAFSNLGNMAQGIALAAYIYMLSQSVGMYSAFLLIRFAPQFVLVSFVGKIVDRYSRRYTTTIINILLGLISIVMAFFSGNIAVIMVMALLAGVVELPYLPALSSSVPSLVRKNHLSLANGLLGVFSGLARIIGAGIAAFGLLTDAVVWVMIFNALTFFISAFVSWISLPTKNQDLDQEENTGESGKSEPKIPVGFWGIFRYLRGNRTLKLLVLGSTLIWGCLSLSDVLLVPVLSAEVSGGEKYYGIYRLIAAIGMALGSYFSDKWHKWFATERLLSYGYAAPLLVVAVGTIGLAFWPMTFGLVFYLLLWVALMLPANLLAVELQHTPNAFRGRVMVVADAVDGFLFIVLMVVVPQWVRFANVQNLLWLTALPFAFISLVWTFDWVRNGRSSRHRESIGRGEVS
ncbi:Major Facilitator Superfamily protein [Marininema mesophilum]|uniref:Major Facilitator Superfamily protein n=1 Tax=Marininema mesophilum TaxID=1048340 RepID=A0A1H3BJ18_9BACL|nr:MFS transporter [Marininema mesophilum]SDX41952.1 Major Facilitator Superfamily protein [Marininema mesophilum]